MLSTVDEETSDEILKRYAYSVYQRAQSEEHEVVFFAFLNQPCYFSVSAKFLSAYDHTMY